jgi:hypothetical protein
MSVLGQVLRNPDAFTEPVIARHPVSLEEQSLRLSRIW